jgi:hypothetical protein
MRLHWLLDIPESARARRGRNLAGGIATSVAGAANAVIGSLAARDAAGDQTHAADSNASNVENTTANANTGITTAATAAGAGATDAATAGANDVEGTAAKGGTAVTGAAGTANEGLNPYSEAGSTAAQQLQGIAANGNQQPTLSQLQISPAYQFQLQQGEAALNRSAAAAGGAISGGNIKSTENFAQGMAGSAYQNAFSDYETAQQNNVANLQGIANAGQNAATTQGSNTMNAAQYGATTANTAATTSANLNTNASQYAGTTGLQGAETTGTNTINAADLGAQYLQLGANDQAAGVIGAANAEESGVNAQAKAVQDILG